MDLSPYASAAEVHSVEGRVGCGKTQRLVEAVLDLLAQGVPPREIILFAATPAAACALERRLKAVVPRKPKPARVGGAASSWASRSAFFWKM